MTTLTDVVDALKQHFEQAEADAKAFLEQHLPVVADVAEKAASNPALAAILNAAHLGEVPEFLQAIADMVTKADAALADAKARGAAEATAAAQQPVTDPAGAAPAVPPPAA